MECKQLYTSGLRVYLLDNYNSMDFSLLSLYLASYTLRFLVDHWIKEADHFHNATARAREGLYTRNYTAFDTLVSTIRTKENSYFIYACKYELYILCSNNNINFSDHITEITRNYTAFGILISTTRTEENGYSIYACKYDLYILFNRNNIAFNDQ